MRQLRVMAVIIFMRLVQAHSVGRAVLPPTRVMLSSGRQSWQRGGRGGGFKGMLEEGGYRLMQIERQEQIQSKAGDL